MANVKCRAVIMDYDGHGERTFEFEADAGFLDLPVDEVIEGVIRRISESDGLHTPMRYELNGAKRYDDKNLVGAMGSFLLKDGSHSPFIAMIGPAA